VGDKKRRSNKTSCFFLYKNYAMAQDKSIKEAKKAQVEHVIHNKGGRISDKDSYGKDPNPPKDTKY